MIDSLLKIIPLVKHKPHPFAQLAGKNYAIATFHWPVNVDHRENLRSLVEGLSTVARTLPVLFPVHPQTRAGLEAHQLLDELITTKGLTVSKPLGYADFIRRVMDAGLVLTDSGGLQEETTCLGVPCLTVRSTTERPITITDGTNQLIGLGAIAQAAQSQIGRQRAPPRPYGMARQRSE